MKVKSGVTIAVGLVGAMATIWQMSAVQASSGKELTSAPQVIGPLILAGEDANHAYVGSKNCRKCHFKEYKSWSDTAHAKAFDILLPGNSAEAKKAHGLDPAKDYSTDEKCVKCHVVGLGKEGGYEIGGDEKKMKDLLGVGCESCHGPGEAYIEFHEKVMKEKMNYKSEQMHALGMAKITADTCKQCHNEESPTFDASKPFDFEEMSKTGVHDHHELKYRTD